MAEQRMRELERERGALWLAERLRRGDVERSMVELAAYAGDAEAREVLGYCHLGHCEHSSYQETLWQHAESLDFGLWLRGLERWPGALREAELACDVVMWGEEREPYGWRDGAAGLVRWIRVVAERKGEQRVREAICERLREWALR